MKFTSTAYPHSTITTGVAVMFHKKATVITILAYSIVSSLVLIKFMVAYSINCGIECLYLYLIQAPVKLTLQIGNSDSLLNQKVLIAPQVALACLPFCSTSIAKLIPTSAPHVIAPLAELNY